MRILCHCILTILILLLCSECVGGLRVSSGLRAGMMLSTTSSFSHRRTSSPIITTMLEKSIGSERRTRSIMGLPSSTRLSLSSISISDGVVVNNDAVSKSSSRLFAGGTQGQKVSKRGTIGFLEEEYGEWLTFYNLRSYSNIFLHISLSSLFIICNIQRKMHNKNQRIECL